MTNSATVTALESKRSARIGREDVFAAADMLVSDGLKPTIQAVRAKLGRGSPNTIQSHLDEWWTLLGQRIMGSPGDPLSVPKPVSDALLSLWNLSLREAQGTLHDTLAAKTSAADTRESELSHRESQLLAREQALEASQATLTNTLNATLEQNSEYRGRQATLERDLVQERDRVQATRSALDSIGEQLKTTQRELQVSLALRLRERNEASAYAKEVEAHAAREIDRARQELKETKRKLGDVEKAHRDESKALKEELKVKERALEEIRHEVRVLIAKKPLAPAPHVRRRNPSRSTGRNRTKRESEK